MTAQPTQMPALRVGRDPNGATWCTVRSPAQWLAALDSAGASYDALRGVLELDPAVADASEDPARRDRERLRASADTVRGCDGAEYRSDPRADVVLVRPACGGDFARLPGFGGRGADIGRLRRPLGLAVDARNLLYVADSHNHRVQVVRPHDGSVAVVLGARDAWGRPTPGDDDGAMREPVDVAIDKRTCLVYVLDRAAERVHVFDGRFRHVVSFAVVRTSPPGAAPPPLDLAAIAVDDDGSVLILDLAWPRLLHLGADGAPLAEVSLGATAHPRFAGLRGRRRFATSGVAIVGPLDAGTPDVAWHRVLVDADAPAGTGIEVQTFASNDPAGPPTEWAPGAPVRIPVAGAEPPSGEYDRLVLPAHRTDPAPPTDRGQYLWVRLTLVGRRDRPGDDVAVDSPRVRGLRVLFPRNSYLQSLPRMYSRRHREPPGATFLERVLALFEHRLTDYEQRYEDVSRLVNVDAAPEDWIEWLGSWFGLAFDPSWPVERKRLLLAEIASLYRRRGTPAALARFIEIYTGKAPALVEAFTRRPRGSQTLGRTVLGDVRAGEVAGDPAAYAHRFTAYVYIDSEDDRARMEPVVRKILAEQRPAHTAVDVHIVLPAARVGAQASVGLDFVVGGPDHPGAVLGLDHAPGRAGDPRDFRPILGRATLAGPPGQSTRIDDSLRVE